jgi:hypothetical protein
MHAIGVAFKMFGIWELESEVLGILDGAVIRFPNFLPGK